MKSKLNLMLKNKVYLPKMVISIFHLIKTSQNSD